MIERLPFAAFILGTSATLLATGVPYTFPFLFSEYKRPLINAELGLGTGSLVFGVAAGTESTLNALYFAEKGKTKQAYIEVFKGACYTIPALAISGAAFGAIAGRNRMLFCAAAGAFLGGFYLRENLYLVHKISRNVAHFKSSEPPIM